MLNPVVRQELQAHGLPLDLLQLVSINGEWLYRFEKVLALEGLALLALLVVTWATGAFSFRYRALFGTFASSVVLLAALAGGARSYLSRSLDGTYTNDRKLLSLRSLGGNQLQQRLQRLVSEPVTLEGILQRGVLRVGVRADGMPWSFRNRFGELVGYDIDLASGLARSLGVRIEWREAPLQSLELWLDEQRLDIAIGGIQASPQRAVRHRLSEGYQRVHLALVVPDSNVAMLQNLRQRPLGRPLKLAVTDPQLIGGDLRDKLTNELVGPDVRLSLQLIPLPAKQRFFCLQASVTLTPSSQRLKAAPHGLSFIPGPVYWHRSMTVLPVSWSGRSPAMTQRCSVTSMPGLRGSRPAVPWSLSSGTGC